MKRKILVLTAAALMLAMTLISALPAVAAPTDPDCGWWRDRTYSNLTGMEWYGYWCDWGEDNGGWTLYSLWNDVDGYIPLSY